MKIFAHRGASGIEPENTLLAIQKALDMNVDGIEIDVHCVNGELIVIHDRWLDKTTNGEGRVQDKSFSEIRQLDAGKGETIPTLWEVLELVNGQCDLNIELKSDNSVVKTIELLNQSISKHKFKQSQFLISSFNHHLLQQFKLIDSSWKIGALTASCPIEYAAFAQKLNAYSIHLDIDCLNQNFIDDAHARGLLVYVYTVDYQADMLDLKNKNVDGIFSNQLHLAIRTLREAN